ncbi:MAG: DUF58 domain-containing protein [Rhodocyclaceae bacterium]|nr:MAG: DUF58 domain-containing protein [Rhodocyclaceae bacterium]
MSKLALFRFVFVSSRWLRQRLTPAGLVIVALSGFAGAFGLDTQSNLAHMVFSLGISFVVVDAVAAALLRRRAPRLAVRRHLPEFFTCGEPARYRIEVRNDGAIPAQACRLVEQLRQPWPSPAALQHHRGPATTNRFDRRVGYPAFLDMLRRLRALDVERLALPPLLPGQRFDIDVPAQPTARGLAVFESLWLVMAGPLGLVETRVPVTVVAGSLPVLPARLPVELLPASNHRLLQPGGISLAQHVGDTEEFRSLRDYRPGDPMRAIHWRSFARTGKPLVREFQEEFFSRHALVLDTAAPYPFAPAFETAVSMAAWLVARPRDADSLLDLMFVGDRVHRLTAGRGLGGADALLRVLATVAPTPAESIEPLLATLERNAAQVSSLVAIFLVWDEPRRNAVRRLLARGVRPVVLIMEQEGTPAVDDDGGFAGILRRIVIPAAPPEIAAAMQAT